jgi:hypothetical protein
MSILKFFILTSILSFRSSFQSDSSSNQTPSVTAEVPNLSSSLTHEIYYPPTLKDISKKYLLTYREDFITFPYEYFIYFNSSRSGLNNDTVFIIGYLATMIHQSYIKNKSFDIDNIFEANNTDIKILEIALTDVLCSRLFESSLIENKFNNLRNHLYSNFYRFDLEIFSITPSELLAIEFDDGSTPELHKYLFNLNQSFKDYFSKKYILGDLIRGGTGRSMLDLYFKYFDLLAFPAKLILSLAHVMNSNFSGPLPPHSDEISLINRSYKTAFMYPQLVIDFAPIIKRVYDLWYLPFDNFSIKYLYSDFENFSPYLTLLNISFDMDMEINDDQLIIYDRQFRYKDSILYETNNPHNFSQIIIDFSNFIIDKKRSPAEKIFYYSTSACEFSQINSYPFLIPSLNNVESSDLILMKFGNLDCDLQRLAKSYLENPILFKLNLIGYGFLLLEIKDFNHFLKNQNPRAVEMLMGNLYGHLIR